MTPPSGWEIARQSRPGAPAFSGPAISDIPGDRKGAFWQAAQASAKPTAAVAMRDFKPTLETIAEA
jgi:hypothetical protein